MLLQGVMCVVLVGVVTGRPHPDRPPPHAPPQYAAPSPAPYHVPAKEEPPKPYAFDYGVKDEYSGSNFGHQENSDGKAVSGSYQVALPDGRIQTVKYVADHYNGFQAEVTYEGQPKYPDHPPRTPYKQSPQPSYPQPPVYQPRPQPPVYQPAYPLGKEEEDVVDEQVYEPVNVGETVYRDHVEQYK